MRVITTVALVLLIVGGLNWLAVGVAETDIVAAIFGGQSAMLSRLIYVLVGISAIIVAFAMPHFMRSDVYAGVTTRNQP